MKYTAQRWTGVCSAAQEYFEKVAKGESTDALPKGLRAAALRLVRGAIDGAGHKMSDQNRSCLQIAMNALEKIRLCKTTNEALAVLTVIRLLLEKEEPYTRDERNLAKTVAEFFGQILKTGQAERSNEYVHGIPEDEDDE